MTKPQNTDPNPLAFTKAALNDLVEAHLQMLGNKAARAFLRALAARAAGPASEKVVGMRDPGHDAENARQVRVWLQERISVWLARHG